MGQHRPHTGTVHPPQTALVTHPNSIKDRSYYLLCTAEFACSPPRLLTDATLPVPALETGNVFKLCCPTISTLWGQSLCSQQAPLSTAVLFSPSRDPDIHPSGLEGQRDLEVLGKGHFLF